MKINFPLSYQLLAEVLITAIIMSSAVFVFLPRPAQAAPTFAFEVNPIETITSIKTIIKDFILDALAWALTTFVLAKISQSTTNWIRGGSTPSIVRDWRGFLLGAAQQATNQFNSYYTSVLSGSQLPANYNSLLSQLVISDFTNSLNSTLESQIFSTLSSSGVTNTVLNDYRSDFTSGGGWNTFRALTQPNNDVYNIYFQSIEAKVKAVQTARKAKENEAIAGSGFISKVDQVNNLIHTPGNVLASFVQTGIADSPLRKIGVADEITEILLALLTSGYERILSEGLSPIADGFTSISSSLPSVVVSVNPTDIPLGEKATVSWTVINATSCIRLGAWGGSTAATGGTLVISPTSTGTFTYGLTCTNASGSGDDKATLTVGSQLTPVIILGFTDNNVTTAESTTIRWDVTNKPTLCISGGDWQPQEPKKIPSGSESVSKSVTGTYTYKLSCFNALGSSEKSATLRVTEPTSSSGSFGVCLPGEVFVFGVGCI